MGDAERTSASAGAPGPLTISEETCRDLRQALRREWVETNGLGSFACGTIAGAATRRYHAILCVATRPPVGRMVLVNNAEQALVDGNDWYELSTNLYPGVVQPEGYRALTGFRLDPWPTWTWRVGAFTVERELFMPHGVQATVVRWRLLEGPGPAELVVRPLVSGRDYHATHHENGDISKRAAIDDDRVTLDLYDGLPSLRIHHDGRYAHDPMWYRRFQLALERERGLEFEEDLFAPGELRFALRPGGTATAVFATDGRRTFDVEQLALGERSRRANLAAALASKGELPARLAVAADQFLVARSGGATVIAGYPWFTDWGRDTFIALPGLTLATGRPTLAREILTAFAPHVSDGMIPNRFPDAGEGPEYNTVDASLWYVIAVGQYLAATGDEETVRARLWSAVRNILDGYRKGTRYRIAVDGDGLVYAGVPGVQLTWMDAKVGDWVVTPRIGKPVEIQALWLRALAVAIDLGRRFGEAPLARDLELLRRTAADSFSAAFWHEAGGYLYDVVDGATRDASLRPNQLYALAADPAGGPPIVEPGRAAHALDAVERHLLTPVGLRTLAPSDAGYHGRCTGSQHDRDAAYHMGTVWPHLLGVYADACRLVRGERIGRKLAARFAGHLGDAGIGQVSEIFDGDPPHEPRGCFAQAWAVAELLRIAVEES
jgi:predicted glycogen debranching enzyme